MRLTCVGCGLERVEIKLPPRKLSSDEFVSIVSDEHRKISPQCQAKDVLVDIEMASPDGVAACR